MRNVFRLIALLSILLGMSGCATYSNFVNSFAPEIKKSEFDSGSGESLQQSSAKSPLCPAPPPPPIQEVYMVMPEDGGKAGTVAVALADGSEFVLHGDYSAMSLAGDDKKTYVSSRDEMLNTFGTAVSALPQAPVSATLYFVLGKDVLTPESKLEADRIFNEIVKRQVPEVLIVGHTDTVGSTKTNDKLSLKRAEKVRQSLIELGVPETNIQVVGRGERDLLVKTPDKTKEPKNRRAEINVR